VRSNQLVGYGLVVGLDGTGDQTSQAPFTVQSLKNMLASFGVTIPPNVNPQLKNVAAVAIHAELPPFAKPGQTIDVTVSSIGNAGSLRGGSLLMTPLRGADGEVYAIAQGSLWSAASACRAGRLADLGQRAQRRPHSRTAPSSSARCRATSAASSPSVVLNLHTPTSPRPAPGRRHQRAARPGTARAIDGGVGAVPRPSIPCRQRIGFISTLEEPRGRARATRRPR
jgi:flagellar P-ring protein FlgI